MKNFLLIFIIFFTFHSFTFSQSIGNYSFTASSGSFSALSGATSITFSNGTDESFSSSAITIGFDFYYMGTKYTSFKVSTNGFITFASNPSALDGSGNNMSSIGSSIRPIIAPLWDDLNLSSGGASYKLTGTSPNQILTVEWLTAKWNSIASSAVISLQLNLYETTGKIEFIYRQESGSVNNGSASIGLGGNSSGVYLSLNGSGSSPTASTSTATNNINTKPADGQTYTFTPPTPSAATSLSFTNIQTTQMDLNWTDNSSDETGFAIYNSTDNATFTYVTKTSASATSYTATGLSSSTTYYWKVYAVSEGGMSSALSGNNSTLPIELSSFNYSLINNNVILNWITTSEINNDKIEIERLNTTNNIWNKIGSLNGYGNSNTPKEYSFTDKNLKTGTYNYRLKQIDYNGNFEYHYLNKDVTISNPNLFSLSQNYPNPFNPNTKINYSIPYSENIKLILFDATGKEIATLLNEFKDAGSYEFIFDGNNYSSGIYFYKLETNNYSKTFKMMLIK